MPRKSIDASAAVAGGSAANSVPRKTERSHEENQERAYIAASRRSDRSIEARVQSARMASEIHKKRTGKGFKVSEEIVMKEEMYEEEEDDLPRQFRGLTSHLHATSPALASRLSAYVSTQVAMHSALAAREREIEKQFAEQFPDYQAALSRTQSGYAAPFAHAPQERHTSPPHYQHRHSMDAAMPSRSGSIQPDSPHSDQTPIASPQQQYSMPDMSFPVTTTAQMSPSKYFTTELPNDVKQLANLDWSDSLTPALYGVDAGAMDIDSGGNFGNWVDMLSTTSSESYDQMPAKVPITTSSGDYFSSNSHPTSQHLTLPGGNSTIGTPGGGAGGDAWDSWIDSDSYAPDGTDKH